MPGEGLRRGSRRGGEPQEARASWCDLRVELDPETDGDRAAAI